jgi:glycosyltransferase involved in cell wall biosynthesis
VVFHAANQGVGGAVLTGYARALERGADILVKIDGDGQMDPAILPAFTLPIALGEADYTKGNRFFDLAEIGNMPRVRILGNAVLSFMSKLSSGYWDIFDPTNGYTAIRAEVARELPAARLSRRYFFETDMLFRLNTLRAVVFDVPMHARYADEQSSLRIGGILGEFLYKHVRNFGKRIFYNYFLRDLSAASIELLAGIALLLFGLVYGGWQWIRSSGLDEATPAGTVMLSAMPVILGFQLLLAFLAHDVASVPRRVLRRRPPRPRPDAAR